MESRSHFLTWAVAASIAGAVFVAFYPAAPGSLLSQDTQSEDTATIAQLAEGDRYAQDEWGLVVQSSFTVPSAQRFGYSEVRADVALQNLSPAELIYYNTALAGDPGYPALMLRDAAGIFHSLSLAQFGSSTVAGSSLVAQPAAVPGRWILGYQVPTASASDTELVAVWKGAPVAAWSLTGAGTDFFEGWARPSEFEEVRWGQEIRWSENLVVTPLGADLEACGDAAVGPVVAVYGLVMQVRNDGTTDAVWTGVPYPSEAAIAIWPDGASARNGGLLSGETHVAEGDSSASDPVQGLGPAARIIPPQVTELRMLGFSLPRDSRFSSPFSLPQSVALYPPLGSPLWLETSGNQLIDFTVTPDVCNEVTQGSSFDVAAPSS